MFYEIKLHFHQFLEIIGISLIGKYKMYTLCSGEGGGSIIIRKIIYKAKIDYVSPSRF